MKDVEQLCGFTIGEGRERRNGACKDAAALSLFGEERD